MHPCHYASNCRRRVSGQVSVLRLLWRGLGRRDGASAGDGLASRSLESFGDEGVGGVHFAPDAEGVVADRCRRR